MSYGVLPVFYSGQIFSATVHGNALQAYVQNLSDDINGIQMPFMGVYWLGDLEYTYEWSGRIRHKFNTLRYWVKSAAQILVNNTVVQEFSAPGWHSGTVDLSALNLSIDGIYEVRVTALNGQFRVLLLAETTTLTLPTLASFADGTAPTAAQWNDLCAYASILAQSRMLPQPTYAQHVQTAPWSRQWTGVFPFYGTLQHRARYLAYSITVHAPYHASRYGNGFDHDGYLDEYDHLRRYQYVNNDEQWGIARLYINSELIAKFAAAHVFSPMPTGPDFGEFYREVRGHGAPSYTFTSDEYGLLDLETYAPDLEYGQVYSLVVHYVDSTHWDLYDSCRVNFLYEVPALQPPHGWRQFRPWQHGSIVRGTSDSVPAIGDLINNLQQLSSVLPFNYPTRLVRGTTEAFGLRKWRWLHFEITPESSENNATLRYYYNNEERSIILKHKQGEFGVFDLESAEGLYPGTRYTLYNVLWALEDVRP